jgi:hypothetical protein
MANIRPEVYKAIRENDLSSVVFIDPFHTVTRQAKRNLLIASFVALLIAVLQLEVTGFLGLQATNTNLGNSLAQGLACLVVTYFLISFIFHVFVDYTAWKFHRERQMTEPYLDLIRLLENQISVTGDQIGNACGALQGIVIENDMPSQIDAKTMIESALGQLKSIDKNIVALVEETKPLLGSWAATINGMNRLHARLRMRFLSLWCLDIVFPIGLALLAAWNTRNGVFAVIERIG